MRFGCEPATKPVVWHMTDPGGRPLARFQDPKSARARESGTTHAEAEKRSVWKGGKKETLARKLYHSLGSSIGVQ